MPDRPDERGDGGDADPTVDPQEERGDLGGARSTLDALGHDPQPADEADGPQERPQRPGWQSCGRGRIGSLGADVADEHEDERQGDGGGRTGEVDRQRQAARVGRVQTVRGDVGWDGQRGQRTDGERAGEGTPPAHHGGPDRRPRRRSAPAPISTTARAARIGSATSVMEVAESLGPAFEDGLGVRAGDAGVLGLGVGSLDAGGADPLDPGIGDGVAATATVNVQVSRSGWPSTCEMAVDLTVKLPLVSGASGRAIIRRSSFGSTPPVAIVAPLASRMSRLLSAVRSSV
jgi:hypothetical protein